MLDTLPHAALEVVPNAKLFVHEERPDVVACAMLPALRASPRLTSEAPVRRAS